MQRIVVSTLQCALIAGIVIGLTTTGATARVWTSSDGKEIEAEYVGYENGVVQLRRDGKVYDIPLQSLSEADRLLVGDDAFSKKLRENPEDVEAFVNRGMAHLNRKQYEQAMRDLSRAIQLNPNHAEAHDGRGQVYAQTDQPTKAHNDFERAIKLDPQLASAYRHRGDNYKALGKSKDGENIVTRRIENYRKSYQAARREQLRNKGWQPLNSTSGNVSRYGGIGMLAQADYDFADRLERGYRGGIGIGGGGVHIGGGGIHIGGGGYCAGCGCGGDCGCGGKGTPGEGDPALSVYPEKVQQGEMITIVANPAELAKGMPVVEAESGKGRPKTAYDSRFKRREAAEGSDMPDIKSVKFYRDVDADGKLDEKKDEYLAKDEDGSDGFRATVSTAQFPPGKHKYFAKPTGAGASAMTPEQMASLADKLEEAAAKEKAIAQQASQAAESAGLSEEQAGQMTKDQESIGETASDALDKLKQTLPEAAELVADASKPIKAVGNLMKAAEAKPGEESKEKASSAGSKAEEAAEKLAEAAAKLREASESEDAGYVAGAPVSGRGEVTPAQVAAGPGPGKGSGPGSGDGGKGADGDDDGGGGYGDDDDRDTHIHDDDDIIVDDAIEKALGYCADGDYHHAIEEYDRLVVDEPDNVIYRSGRAGAYLNRGGYDYAIRDYDVLLAEDRPDVLTVAQRVEFYYNRGCAHLAANNLDAALADFGMCIKLDELGKLAYMAYNNRGISYAKKGQIDLAIADFNRAIEINADQALAYRNRALAYKKLGKMVEAEQDMARATDLSSL
jgi:tetratricopeptide (TPR) repeat protein